MAKPSVRHRPPSPVMKANVFGKLTALFAKHGLNPAKTIGKGAMNRSRADIFGKIRGMNNANQG